MASVILDHSEYLCFVNVLYTRIMVSSFDHYDSCSFESTPRANRLLVNHDMIHWWWSSRPHDLSGGGPDMHELLSFCAIVVAPGPTKGGPSPENQLRPPLDPYM